MIGLIEFSWVEMLSFGSNENHLIIIFIISLWKSDDFLKFGEIAFAVNSSNAP